MLESLKLIYQEVKEKSKSAQQNYQPKYRGKPDYYEPDNKDDDYIIRDGFARDRDRILFSRAFRRLEHKAQIYTHEKGDHFRTRLTHSLEVMQISRSIATNVAANEILTEAIALGHDIGHTPFGHQGERTLDSIMRGDDNLGGKIAKSRNLGGFKHNIHGVRILESIEAKENIGSGLNLTWQVLDGVIKHTGIDKKELEFTIEGNISDVMLERMNYLSKKYFDCEYKKLKFPMTLEGQIVKISDEIAQRQHDIDDGLRDKDLRISLDRMKSELLSLINNMISEPLNEKNCFIDEQLVNVRELLGRLDSKPIYKSTANDDVELLDKLNFVRSIINFFIRDVTLEILKRINLSNTFIKNDTEDKVIVESIADYSSFGKAINDYIERVINTQIINSYDVNRFDGKAVYIIRQIFKAYYDNPSQMPQYMLKRIIKEIRAIPLSEECYLEFKGKNRLKITDISFSKSDKQGLKVFIDILKLEFDEVILIINDERYYLKLNKDLRTAVELIGFDPRNGKVSEAKICEYISTLNQIYMRNITDHIAGMTDNYAKKEYSQLYLV